MAKVKDKDMEGSEQRTAMLAALLAQAPRAAAAISRDGSRYMGPCVVQSPGAWVRVGPTWLVPGIGWVTVGWGARQWGTSQGLAELASHATATPTWHAVGVSISPTPNLVFECTREALSSDSMRDVATIAREAEELEARRG